METGAYPGRMSAWQAIRMLRARPPGLACGDDDRRAVFAAALEQSEQLMRAAAAVGYAARPLPLFYSLSQAGRAIAAARLSGSAWRLMSHGLDDPPQVEAGDLMRRRIEPRPADERLLTADRRDAFAAVAEAVGSDTLTGPIELGEVWAAIPDLIPQAPQIPNPDPGWRRPLVVFERSWDEDPHAVTLDMYRPLSMLVAGLPPGANAEQLFEELSRYPAVHGAHIWTDPHLGEEGTASQVVRGYSPHGQECPRIVWPGSRSRHPRFDEVAPEYRNSGVRVLLPRVANRDYMAPLLLWWLLLFGLSSVARYDPELWVAALDVNASDQAVPIEATLDTALEVLDYLILEALIGQVSFTPARD